MPKCFFCDHQREHIFENEHFFAQFDDFAVSPGHSLIVPKRHVKSLLDLDDAEWSSLYEALKSTVTAIESTDLREIYSNPPTDRAAPFFKRILEHSAIGKKPDGYNFGVNEGRAAGRTVDHLHVQVIPRYSGDVTNPTGGVRNVIPGLGDYTK